MARTGSSGTGWRTPAALAVLAVVASLYFAREVLIPIALAALLTFLLAPLVRRLESLRIPRIGAVVVVVGLAVTALAAVGWALEDQAVGIVKRLPEYRVNVVRKFEALRHVASGSLGGAGRAITDLGNDLSQPTDSSDPTAAAPAPPTNESEPVPVRVVDTATTPFVYAQMVLGPVFRPLLMAGIVFVFTIFMLMKREDLRNRFIRLVGQPSMHLTTQALDDAAQRVNRYLVMQLIANTGAGIAVGLGLFLLGVPSAVLWGLLVIVLRFIPYVGMWVAAALPLALSVAQSPDWTQPLLALSLFAVVEVVIANVVEPLLLGTGTGISPMAILVSAVFWGWLWGGVGLILATPLTVCVAVIGRHVRHLEFLDILLGDEAVLPEEARLYQRLLAGDADEATTIVDKFVKANPPSDVYDRLLVPALVLAEADRHRGDLDEARERFILQTMEAMLEDLAPAPPPAAHGPAAPNAAPVLCLPIWDRADELAGRMFTQLLQTAGIAAENFSAQAFSGEIVAAVVERQPSIVCLSAVPPGATVAARALSKRLRAKIPALHIVIGFWHPQTDVAAATKNLGVAPADRVVTTMSDGLQVIKALMASSGASASRGTDVAALLDV